jgi:hypothetical protein
MSKKLLQKALSAPGNLRFGDMVKLAENFGFRLSLTARSAHRFDVDRRLTIFITRIAFVSSCSLK